MSRLEKKLRYSNAFSSLNSLRNLMAFDGPGTMAGKEKEIVLDAIEIATEPTEESFTKALMYGFHNTGDSIRSSALELAKVIVEGLANKYITEKDLEGLKDSLTKASDKLFNSNPALVVKIDHLMTLLNKAKRDELPITNKLLVKY